MLTMEEVKTDALVYDRRTTYLSSFYDIDKRDTTPVSTERKIETSKEKPKYLKKNYETLTPYDEHIPMDLMWQLDKIPRQALNHELQLRHDSVRIDHDRKKVQKSRPRLVMCPALSIDDAPDKERDLICQETYTSTFICQTRKATETLKKIERSFPKSGTLHSGVQIKLPKLQPAKKVPSEWKMESVIFEKHSLRGSVDETKEFWLDPNRIRKANY